MPEEKKKKNVSPILIIIIVISVVLLLIVAGVFFLWQRYKVLSNKVVVSSPTPVVTETPILSPTPSISTPITPTPTQTKHIYHTPEPSDVVGGFMRLTLGTIPGANIDYELAKTYLTPTLSSQFTDSSFIPELYCIQQGPDSVQMVSEDIMGDAVDVGVEGIYGGQTEIRWDFILTNDGSGFKIAEVQCH